MDSVKIYICKSVSDNFIISHYFYIINNSEYHLGKYPKGRILPKGTTKPYTVIGEKTLCNECYNEFLSKFDAGADKKMFYIGYPLINCESLICGISLQILMLTITIGFASVSFLKYGLKISVIVFIIFLVIYLIIERFRQMYYITVSCKHIKDNTTGESSVYNV